MTLAGTRAEKLEEHVRRDRPHGAPHEMRRSADCEPDATRVVLGELDRDVGRRVPGADDEDVAALIGPGADEVTRVHELAREAAEPGPRRDGRRPVITCGEHDYRGLDHARRRVELPAAPRVVDAVDLAPELQRDLLALHIAVEVGDHVLARRPPARREGDPLARQMRDEARGVEAEVVVAGPPRNRRCRCTIDHQCTDTVPVLEFARHSQTRWARADHDGVEWIPGLRGHPHLRSLSDHGLPGGAGAAASVLHSVTEGNSQQVCHR